MLVIVAPQNPTVGLPDGTVVTYKGNGDSSVIRLKDLLREPEMKQVEKVLRKLLAKLSELGISFSLRRVSVEQDEEVEGWRYVLAEVELSVTVSLFVLLEDPLLQHTYSSLDAEEASKLLLVLDHV